MGFSLKLNHDHKQPIVLESLQKKGEGRVFGQEICFREINLKIGNFDLLKRLRDMIDILGIKYL